MSLFELNPLLFERIVLEALEEDLGRGGDITSESVIEPDLHGSASIVAREGGRICGMSICEAVFLAVDSNTLFQQHVQDGDDVEPGTCLATVSGNARSLLTAERTALNFLGHLSGIATATRRIVTEIRGTSARIADTRKTTPGLRTLEKYAVRVGGGINHRFGLDDAVLIKDNHIALSKSIESAVKNARTRVGHLVSIEVEVTDVGQLEQAIQAGADVVLLDNMDISALSECVRIAKGQVLLEASGGVTYDNVKAIAETGVDVISIGALTHSSKCLDVAMDMDI
jgi:nicotinate-nucleotide pyrophosphorylase (carboxylating)